MRLVILCEGDTEKRVLKQFLQPFTAGFTSVDLLKTTGNAKLKAEFKILAETELEDDPNAVVFCLIDLQEAPFSFPRNVEDDANPYLARYTYIQIYMKEAINPGFRDRFYAFPVVMELETWLLADVEALNSYFRTRQISPWTAPESVLRPINELKNLTRRFKGEDYLKMRHTLALFKLANAERVYQDACPHFEDMINQLLVLQEVAPVKLSPSFGLPQSALFDQLVLLYKSYDERWHQVEQQNDLTEGDIEEFERIEKQIGAVNTKIAELYTASSS